MGWNTLWRRCGGGSAYVLFRSLLVFQSTFYFFHLSRDELLGSPQLPLLNFGLFYSAPFATLIKSLYVISLVSLLLGYRVELSAPVAGVTRFVLNLLYPSLIYAFNFYTPFLFLALALVERSRRKNPEVAAETPLISLTAVIYFTSGGQKLLHFSNYKAWLPWVILGFGRPEFVHYCPMADCGATRALPYIVSPIEFAIGGLLLFRCTRAFGVLVAVLFHSVMYTTTDLLAVGIMITLTFVCAALVAVPRTVRDVLQDPGTRKLMIATAAFAVAIAGLSLAQGPAVELLLRFLVCGLGLWPLGALAMLSSRDPAPVAKSFLQRGDRAWQAGYLLVLVLFDLIPIAEHYQKTSNFGWTMFPRLILEIRSTT